MDVERAVAQTQRAYYFCEQRMGFRRHHQVFWTARAAIESALIANLGQQPHADAASANHEYERSPKPRVLDGEIPQSRYADRSIGSDRIFREEKDKPEDHEREDSE
jgi:hypothetical protein